MSPSVPRDRVVRHAKQAPPLRTEVASILPVRHATPPVSGDGVQPAGPSLGGALTRCPPITSAAGTPGSPGSPAVGQSGGPSVYLPADEHAEREGAHNAAVTDGDTHATMPDQAFHPAVAIHPETRRSGSR